MLWNPVLYLSLIESSSSWGCKSGVYVWDARKSVCCYGKTPWRHAGDDLIKWKGQIARENNKVFNYSGKKLIINLERDLRSIVITIMLCFWHNLPVWFMKAQIVISGLVRWFCVHYLIGSKSLRGPRTRHLYSCLSAGWKGHQASVSRMLGELSTRKRCKALTANCWRPAQRNLSLLNCPYPTIAVGTMHFSVHFFSYAFFCVEIWPQHCLWLNESGFLYGFF